jgi:hypothetical protein
VGAHGAGHPDGYEVLTLSAGSPPPPSFVTWPEPPVTGPGVLPLTTQHDRPARASQQIPPRQARACARPRRQWRLHAGHARDLRKLAALTDELLRGLWQRAGLTFCTLCAGGGGRFGRGELFPLLRRRRAAAAARRSVARHRQRLKAGASRASSAAAGMPAWRSAPACAPWPSAWPKRQGCDGADLAAGGSPDHGECRAVCNAFQQAFHAQMDPQAFLVAKTLEMRQRHTKFEDTPTRWSPTARNHPAACATCRSFCGWPRLPDWARAGKELAARAWPRRLRCARSSATRPC